MTVTEPGRRRRLTRVDDRPAGVWHGRWASEAGAGATDPYVGCYQFGDYVLEIRRAGEGLCAVWSWAGRNPPTGTNALGTAGDGAPRRLVHERDHTFIVDDEQIDVSLTFESDGRAHVTAVRCEIEQDVLYGVRILAMIA